jgi:hypothetical protein
MQLANCLSLIQTFCLTFTLENLPLPHADVNDRREVFILGRFQYL